MVYFFLKQQQYLQCEVHFGRPHLLRVIAPDGTEYTERYSSARQLEERVTELHVHLRRDGWAGPHGRDARA